MLYRRGWLAYRVGQPKEARADLERARDLSQESGVSWVTPYALYAHVRAWTRDGAPSRVAYVALGHDEGAYAADGMRELLRRSAVWLLDGR